MSHSNTKVCAKEKPVSPNCFMHPAFKRVLKIKAIENGTTFETELHRILAEALGLHNLVDETPLASFRGVTIPRHLRPFQGNSLALTGGIIATVPIAVRAPVEEPTVMLTLISFWLGFNALVLIYTWLVDLLTTR